MFKNRQESTKSCMHVCIQYIIINVFNSPVCGSVIHHNPTWSFELQDDDVTLVLLQLVREVLLEEHE